MFRIQNVRRSWAAVVLPAAVPVALLMAVASISVTQVNIPHGGNVVGAVNVTTTSPLSSSVSLSSSKPGVATVLSSVTVPRGATSAGFKISAVAGAVGCTNISARQGITSPKQVLVYVLPPVSPESSLRLSLSRPAVAGGASLTGSISGPVSAIASTVVQLSSDNPNVTVPATVQLQFVEGGFYVANFPINTSVVAPSTCAVITATQGTARSRVLLKVATISG